MIWKLTPLELPENNSPVWIRTIYSFGEPIPAIFQGTFGIFSSANFQLNWSYPEVVKWANRVGTGGGGSAKPPWIRPSDQLPTDQDETFIRLIYLNYPALRAVYNTSGQVFVTEPINVGYSAKQVAQWRPVTA